MMIHLQGNQLTSLQMMIRKKLSAKILLNDMKNRETHSINLQRENTTLLASPKMLLLIK
jgi:hypothetical protein